MFEISRSSSLTMHWIKEVEIAKSIVELMTSRSTVVRTDSVCTEKDYLECALPQKSKCRRSARSEIRLILTRKTTCVHDL